MSRGKKKSRRMSGAVDGRVFFGRPMRTDGFSVCDSGPGSEAFVPTPARIKELFGPPRTLGAPIDRGETLHAAMDSALENSGFYSLIQHAFELGQPPQGNGFIGYAALSDLKQNGLVSACVETVADDIVREWIDLEYQNAAGEEGALAAVNDAVNGFGLRDVCREAAAQAQYFGGCLIFIDTGVVDPAGLRVPLDLSEKSAELKPGGLRGFTVVEPINVFPGDYNSRDPLRRDYFHPRTWWVLGREVHASRFIKVSTGEVPVLLRPSYNFFGVPHAQNLWDYVLHFQKDRVATSRMLSKYSDFIFKIGGLRGVIGQTGGSAELDKRIAVMARFRSNYGIAAIDKEHEDVVKVESSLAGLTDITRQDLGFLCAINRTPAEKLLGEPPPGFNATGESSIRNYYDHVSSQQEKLLRKAVSTALDCIQLHVSGRIDPSLAFTFRELGGEDRQIESGIRKANTDTLSALVMSEILSPEGARATVEANPDEYLAGLADGIKADREATESAAEGELDAYGGGEAEGGAEAVAGAESPEESVQKSNGKEAEE